MTKKKASTAAIAVVLFIAAGVLIYRNTLPDSYSSRLTEDPETFLKFTVEEESVTSESGVFCLENLTEKKMITGAEYFLQKKRLGKWVDMEPLVPQDFIAEAILIMPQARLNVDWSGAYGSLPAGTYRIIKNCSISDDEQSSDRIKLCVACEFPVQKEAVSSKVSSSSQPPAQVAVFLSSVKDSIAASQYAVKELESELSQEIEAGRLLRFDGPWAVPMGAVGDAEDEFQSMVGYTVYFGDGKGSAGFRSEVICSLTMKRKEGGGYTENRGERSYEVLGDGRFDNFSWIIDHPYVAQAAKSDVSGKSRDEIALMLYRQWMDTLKDWNTSGRTFVVTKYDKPAVKLFTATDTEDWGKKEGRNGTRPIHLGSVKSWIYTCQCRYQFLGYTANVSLGTGYCSKVLGVEPFWVEDFAPGSSAKDFVLTEWADRYTLETRQHCLDSIGNK